MTETVKIYSFTHKIGEHRFGGNIPATSFEHAQRLVPTGEEWGELVEERPVGLMCSICAGDMVVTPKAEPTDEWQEEFE